jgi:CO/xanthine dehydrogenase FAD-binding subunit
VVELDLAWPDGAREAGDREGRVQVVHAGPVEELVVVHRERAVDEPGLEAELLGAVESSVAEEVQPISDSRSTAEYRRLITGVKTKDLLLEAWEAE